jgi:hypothetical protein
MCGGLIRLCAGVVLALGGVALGAPAAQSQDGERVRTFRVTPIVGGDEVLRLGWNVKGVSRDGVIFQSDKAVSNIDVDAAPAAPLPSAFWSTMLTLAGLGGICFVRWMRRRAV